ncbi:MAG: DEAD/DEAH box helicase, partial [Chitinophagaceae bacterium]
MDLRTTIGYSVINDWLQAKGYHPFAFQEEAWQRVLERRSGLVNAPTGCGKTFSVFLGALIDFINHHPTNYQKKAKSGLQLLWVTPLRALAKDIGRAMEEVIFELGMNWKVGIRNGDTTMSDRQKQKRQMPEVLIITPESLHLLLAQKDYPAVFEVLKIIAVDEWHELLGSKRGVQVELAVSRIIGVRAKQRDLDPQRTIPAVIGISATIGNLDEAKQVLISAVLKQLESDTSFIVKANIDKPIDVESILPDEIERYPWAGHLGIKLAEKVLPILENSTTTLIFINTRGMSEIWYQKLLTINPDLAGVIALHHGS